MIGLKSKIIFPLNTELQNSILLLVAASSNAFLVVS